MNIFSDKFRDHATWGGLLFMAEKTNDVRLAVMFLKLALLAVAEENGGSIDVSDSTLREIASREDLDMLQPDFFADPSNNQLRICSPTIRPPE